MRSKELIIALMLSLFSLSVLAQSKVCLKKEVSVYCEEELNGLNSLNGSLYYKEKYYEFSARRAFSRSWCDSTLLNIQKVMVNGKFCITFEEQFLDSDLTLNSVKGPKGSWSYFK